MANACHGNCVGNSVAAVALPCLDGHIEDSLSASRAGGRHKSGIVSMGIRVAGLLVFFAVYVLWVRTVLHREAVRTDQAVIFILLAALFQKWFAY
jgi:hypothetical protein